MHSSTTPIPILEPETSLLQLAPSGTPIGFYLRQNLADFVFWSVLKSNPGLPIYSQRARQKTTSDSLSGEQITISCAGVCPDCQSGARCSLYL